MSAAWEGAAWMDVGLLGDGDARVERGIAHWQLVEA